MTFCSFYLLKFDATEHNVIEKFMHGIGLKQFAFLVPTEESSHKYVLGLIKDDVDNDNIISKFSQIDTKVYACQLEEFMDAYALIGKEYFYNKSFLVEEPDTPACEDYSPELY